MRVSFGEVIQGCLDRTFRSVGFGREFSVSIAFLQGLNVIRSQEFPKYTQAFLFPTVKEMNAAHDSAKHSAGKIRVVPNKRSATGQSRPLVFDLEIGEVDEIVHS